MWLMNLREFMVQEREARQAARKEPVEKTADMEVSSTPFQTLVLRLSRQYGNMIQYVYGRCFNLKIYTSWTNFLMGKYIFLVYW
jgi:hypothetical protein